MGKAAHFPVLPGRVIEIQAGKRISLGRSGPHAIMLQKIIADQMRRLVLRARYAQVDARLAKIDGKKLGMAIGEMQKMHVAETGHVVEFSGGFFSGAGGMGQTHAARGGNRQDLEKFTAINHKNSLFQIFQLGAYLIRSITSSSNISTDRKSVVSGKNVSVRFILVGRL